MFLLATFVSSSRLRSPHSNLSQHSYHRLYSPQSSSHHLCLLHHPSRRPRSFKFVIVSVRCTIRHSDNFIAPFTSFHVSARHLRLIISDRCTIRLMCFCQHSPYSSCCLCSLHHFSCRAPSFPFLVHFRLLHHSPASFHPYFCPRFSSYVISPL